MPNKVGTPLFYLGICLFGAAFLSWAYIGTKGTLTGGGSAVTKKKRHRRHKQTKQLKGKVKDDNII